MPAHCTFHATARTHTHTHARARCCCCCHCRSYILSHIKDLTYLDYRRVNGTDVQSALEQHQVGVHAYTLCSYT